MSQVPERMGRPFKNRTKVSIMLDNRLLQRADALARKQSITRSEAVNRMVWLGVIERPNVVEKEEFCKQIDKIADYCKQLVENGL